MLTECFRNFWQLSQRVVVLLFCLQKRFAAGTKDMLDRWFKHEAFPEQYYIVREGKVASQYM